MILSISGKIGSGKDTVGHIMQILIDMPHFSNKAVIEYLDKKDINYSYENKKFADKLKDIVCLLIGCTREQLEDQDFKNKELGEEWWYTYGKIGNVDILVSYLDMDKEFKNSNNSYIEKLTPRELLQIIGTECIRDKVHPNAWVNALFADYKAKWVPTGDSVAEEDVSLEKEYPNWIITDMRFPNELEAIKSRGGITIRVNRPYTTVVGGNGIPATFSQFHPSETALDNAEFDYTIENNSSIEDLIHTVSLILTKEKII